MNPPKKPNKLIKDRIIIVKTIEKPGKIGLIAVEKQCRKKTLHHKLNKVIQTYTHKNDRA